MHIYCNEKSVAIGKITKYIDSNYYNNNIYMDIYIKYYILLNI